MLISRRSFMKSSAFGVTGTILGLDTLLAAQEGLADVRIAACDWSLGAGGPGGLEIAKASGLDGLEISVGSPADTLQIANPEYRQQYKANMPKTGMVIPSLAMGMLNEAPLASDPRGPAWLQQSIEAAQDLGAKVILLAFFGKGDLRADGKLKTKDVDTVVGRLVEAAPAAQRAGVILGIENTLSAQDNLAILDRVKSDAVRVYYDIRNSTDNGYDVPAEIKLLADRICQIHFKNGGDYLGEGKMAMDPIGEAIQSIKYPGWIVLETSCPSKKREADFQRNADYARRLLKGTPA